MQSITITLPLPDKCLSPNARCHWAVKSKAVAKLRRFAELETRNVAGRVVLGWKQAKYTARFYFPTSRRRDADNAIASIKSALDGVADAGLIANDSGLWPERPEFYTDKDNPRVEITFTKEA